MNLLQPSADPNIVTYSRTLYTCCPLCSCDYKPLRDDYCGNHALYRKGLPDRIYWVQCVGCQHVFANGYFDGAAADFLFAKTQESQQPGYNLEQGRYTAADMVERIRTVHGAPFGNWLDFGFGAGHLLTTAAEYGYDVFGVDARKQSCDTLNNFGFEASVFLPINRVFDIVTLADVLEHLPYPKQFLIQLHAQMNSGSTLFVSCPNTDSFVWRALDHAGQNPFWGEIEHYHNWGFESLKRLLSQTGFMTVQYNVSRRYRACQEVIAKRLDP